MSQLELTGLTKIYRSTRQAVTAVDALDLRMDAGDIVALLGSSGCGKTSTLRMIAGFETANGGSIRIAGRDVGRLRPAARGIAMAFEGYSLYPPMTVRENIGFALQSAKVPAAEVCKRVDEMAEMLEIGDILERYPASISGGQQQRASLARALVREADLHLLDEPMGQLEPQLRTLLRGRIKHHLKSRAQTAILVTHDQTAANALADRIAVMEAGVLQQFATPAEIRDRPANRFTGTFVGEPPMNIIRARPQVDGGRLHLELDGEATLDYPLDAFGEPVRRLFAERDAMAIGVRPHAVRLGGGAAPEEDGAVAGEDAGPGSRATARVIANQWLGDQSHVATAFAGGLLVAVVHERIALEPGDNVRVELAPGDLHLFDALDGRALAHGPEPARRK